VPIEVKICGAFVQGSSKHSGLTLFVHSNAICKDSNVVATELWEVITKARETRHKHLVLSFDNAAGEGKNQYVLAFCALLVSLNWFETVEIHALEPGHTHSYLDALFSHVQRAKRERPLCSVADVVDALSHSFSADPLKPVVVLLERAWDWMRYFDGHTKQLHGQKVPLGFRFFVPAGSRDQLARMLVRDNSQGQWLGYERQATPIEVLTSLPRRDLHVLPLRSATASEQASLVDTVKTALRHALIAQVEADEMLRIISEGTLGAKPVVPAANDTGIGHAATVERPGKNSVGVRLIAQPPRSVQPLPASRSAAAAAAPAPKPPVPLFFKPRVAVITHKAHRLKPLREAAESKASASSGSGSGSAAQTGSMSAAAPMALEPVSPSPTRASPRTERRTPTRHGAMVDWENIDDDDDDD
jgi:hypothetical protein